MRMAVIRTDEWLKEDFDRPVRLCERFQNHFNSQGPDKVYNELLKFGMYRPTRLTNYYFKRMQEYNAWELVEKILSKYKRMWSGPNIPVFLFPIEQKGGFLFRREQNKKSGVSYEDKMFLFLSDYEDPDEIEALFVHEYHHVCRLSSLKKPMKEYTLLDSIIIEGLAEYAVKKFCGEKYLADWCYRYTEREHQLFWERFLENELSRRKNERTHDQLLYGGGRVPPMLGYSAGYNIVKKYYEEHHYSVKLSFSIPADQFIE